MHSLLNNFDRLLILLHEGCTIIHFPRDMFGKCLCSNMHRCQCSSTDKAAIVVIGREVYEVQRNTKSLLNEGMLYRFLKKHPIVADEYKFPTTR